MSDIDDLEDELNGALAGVELRDRVIADLRDSEAARVIDVDAEERVIGWLLNPASRGADFVRLDADTFAIAAHRWIWTAGIAVRRDRSLDTTAAIVAEIARRCDADASLSYREAASVLRALRLIAVPATAPADDVMVLARMAAAWRVTTYARQCMAERIDDALRGARAWQDGDAEIGDAWLGGIHGDDYDGARPTLRAIVSTREAAEAERLAAEQAAEAEQAAKVAEARAAAEAHMAKLRASMAEKMEADIREREANKAVAAARPKAEPTEFALRCAAVLAVITTPKEKASPRPAMARDEASTH